MIETFVAESELDEMVNFFSGKNGVSKYKPAVYPLAYNKLITIGSGKDTKHMRLLAFNAPCLLDGSSKFEYKPESVKPEDFDEIVYSGMNIVHALANMTIDSYCKAIEYGKQARKDEEKAVKELHKAFECLAKSSEYKPIVMAIQEFTSQSDFKLTESDAEDIIIAFMTASEKALILSNVSKGLFWGSACAGFLVGAAGFFFPPLLALAIPLLGTSIGAGFAGAASEKEAKRAIECTKVVNFACVLARFRDMITNRSDFVGECNICTMLFDDMTDVSSVKSYPFVRTLADVLAKHTDQGATCDFLCVEEIKRSSPFIKDYQGGRIFSFYKDIFYRMDVSSSFEEFRTIQDILHGTPSPERPLKYKPESE